MYLFQRWTMLAKILFFCQNLSESNKNDFLCLQLFIERTKREVDALMIRTYGLNL